MLKITNNQLKNILVDPGHIKEVDFDSAVNEAQVKKEDLIEILLDKDLVKDGQLGKAISNFLGYKFINLSQESIDENVLSLIPELVARSRKIIAFSRSTDGLSVAMSDPSDLETKHYLEKSTGDRVIPYYATRRDIQNTLANYKVGIKEAFETSLKKLSSSSITKVKADKVVIDIVDMLLQYGYENRASDIYIEPYREKTVVRFRIDGVVHDVVDIPKQLTDHIRTRIKILAKLRTDEHMSAQDGKIRFDAQDEVVDVRVSVVPVTEGENFVMRLLSARSRKFNLTDIGLSDRNLKTIHNAIQQPHGMILVVGPTGSGKTTTVYSILKILNKRESHILTIEDPVEYDIEGVGQIQVNTRTDLSFDKGLRAIVRQDPDIIMVGEIRDEDTASIAVNSAMTGQLVLTTFHANDAATTLPRLIDMGIEPFLVSSTVNIIIAQRLVRRICERCRQSYSISDNEKKILNSEPLIKELIIKKTKKSLDSIRLYKGRGCDVCGNTGYVGRIGIFEILKMKEDIRKLVMDRKSTVAINKVAKTDSMVSMFEDGIDKIIIGVTTLSEVLRATKA